MVMVVRRGRGSWKGEVSEGGRLLHHEIASFSKGWWSQNSFGWMEARSQEVAVVAKNGGGNSLAWWLGGR